MNAPSHWLRRRAAVGLRIEKAALRLFLERGPDDVSAEDIAEAAGISRRTFFRYFQSRDDILAALPARAMMQACRAVCERPAQESILEALFAIARDLPYAGEDEEMAQMSRQVMARFPEAWARALGRLRRATDYIFAEMAGHRLRLAGRDDAGADVIGAALAAVVVQVYCSWVDEDCDGAFADRLQDGFGALAEIGLPEARRPRS